MSSVHRVISTSEKSSANCVDVDKKVGEMAEEVMTSYHDRFKGKGLTVVGEKTTSSYGNDVDDYRERIGAVKRGNTLLVYHLNRSDGDAIVDNSATIVATHGPKKREIRKLFREVFSRV